MNGRDMFNVLLTARVSQEVFSPAVQTATPPAVS